VCIKLWINLGKRSNNCQIVVETAVDKPKPPSCFLGILLASGCGKQFVSKLYIKR